MGDLSFLEESDEEGIAASVQVKNVKNRKVSFDDDIGEIIFNEPLIKRPLRPDIKRYDTWEVTNQTGNRADLKSHSHDPERCRSKSHSHEPVHKHHGRSYPSWSER